MMTVVANALLSLIVHFVLALENIDPLIYDIDIKSEPIKLSEIQESHLEIVSLSGQQFSCIVPAASKQQNYSDLIPRNTSDDIKSVLGSWQIPDCLELLHGWWTYRICLEQEITQYHTDKDVVLVTTSLGWFSKDFNWSTAVKSDPQVSSKYHSQFYDHGTVCDVTGLPRSTEVRFICQYMALTPVIVEVAEIATCSYVLTIASADLCLVPVLTPREEPKPSSIICSPSLSDESYRKFKNAQRQKLLNRKQHEEELAFRELFPMLPARRLALREKVLNFHRSYRKRVELENLRFAKNLLKECLNFVNEVENNFQKLSTEEIPDLSSTRSVFPHRIAESHVQLLKSLLRFKGFQSSYLDSHFEITDAFAMNKLIAHNHTVEIAYILLERMRNSFENSIAAGQTPKSIEVLQQFMHLLNKLVNLKSTKGLSRLRRSLEHYHPLRIYRPFSPTADFYDFFRSPQVIIERSLFNVLNSTIEISRNAVKFVHLQMYISTLVGSDFDDRSPIRVLFDELDSNAETSTKTVRAFQEALQSPKLQSVLKFLPVGKTGEFVMKASIQNFDQDKMALVISLVDERKSTNYEENLKNYNVKIDVD